MGRESASYYLTLPPELEEAVIVALREGGAEPVAESGHTWIELRVRDPHRYWIDLRVHRAAEPLLEIRIALTNDEWSIRAPLEAGLHRAAGGRGGSARCATRTAASSARRRTTAGRCASRRTTAGAARSSSTRVGDINAPISADHVYMYLHQTGMEARRRRRARVGARARDHEDRADVGRRAGDPGRPPRQPAGDGRAPTRRATTD